MDLGALSKIAIKAAISAGEVIQHYINQDVEVETKEGGEGYASQVVTIVDKECESIILSHLLPTCDEFDIALLSEETEDDGQRFKKDFFWAVDPMDGTLAFINKYPGFSISIALVAKDGTPHLGVVFDPSTNTLYHAIKGVGAYKNGEIWKIDNTNNHLSYVTDKKLKDTPQIEKIEELLQDKCQELGLYQIKEIHGAGSVLNAMFVLEHGPACMIKLPKVNKGGGCIWDYAATSCIYNELGLPATDFAGRRIDLNKKDGPFMNEAGVFYINYRY